MGFKFKTSGIEATLSTFKKYAEGAEEMGGELMEDYARLIFARSQKYVPVRDETRPDKPPPTGRPHDIPGGSLKQSGVVFKGQRPAEWIIGYGGENPTGSAETGRDPFYAVYVHEIPQIHLGEGRVKYLEQAVADFMADFQAEFAQMFAGKKIFQGNPLVGTGAGGEKYLFGGQFGLEPDATTKTAYDAM